MTTDVTVSAPSLVLGPIRVRPDERPTTASLNPARQSDVVAWAPSASAADVVAAVASAHSAFAGWSRESAVARGSVLYRAAAGLERRAGEAADLLVREVGKTRSEAVGEVQRGIDILQYYAGQGSAATGEMLPSRVPNSFVYTAHEPIGPIAVITPWNFPLAIPLWKLAPALVYGNTAIFKPAEHGAAVAWLLAEVLLSAGLPDGVLNVVFGDGPVIGDALLADGAVRGLSFTGSTAVGRKIEAVASRAQIKTQLELGGNNATIVLVDADVELAAGMVVGAAMKYAGQKCTATSRVIVASSIAGSFRDAVVDRVSALVVGDPGSSDAIDVGPVIDRRSQQHFVDAVANACSADGAEVLVGGTALVEGAFEQGCYVSPTVLCGVEPGSTLDQEELFGPVVSLITAEDLDDAVKKANAVRYGLSAAVLTKSLDAAMRCARDLEVGIVKINAESTGLEPQVPFGGIKESGSHYREQGTAARDFFTQLKSVYVHPSGA